MAALAVVDVGIRSGMASGGAEVAAVAPDETDGDTFANDGNTFILFGNGGGGAMVVTINSRQQCSQGHDHDLTVRVTNNQEVAVGPFSRSRWNDENGVVSMTYTGNSLSRKTVRALRG